MEPPDLIDSGASESQQEARPEDSAPPSGDDRRSLATRLVEIAESENAVFFHDEYGDGWVQFEIEGHREQWPVRSKRTKKWLQFLCWKYEGKAPGSEPVNSAIGVLGARGCFQGDEYRLHNRVAPDGGDILLDLADKAWRVVRITPRGWDVEDNTKIVFRRYSHQKAQVMPVAGGDLRHLLEFVNITDKDHQLLLLVYIVSCFVPDIPHPVPVLHGPQGAAKTTLLRICRRIVDPSAAEVLSMPHDVTALIQQMSHHWQIYYDNATRVSQVQSDALCRAVTGDGGSKRELYTDDEDIIYSYRRCCALNGINVAATKPDLLDRALLFALKAISKAKRRPEKAMWAEFERVRPQLVGAALDALSKALRVLPTVHLNHLDRMADFQIVGCAIAEALGFTRDEFLEAFDRNYRERNEEIIASDAVATAVVMFMEERTRWEGTPTELYGLLEPIATRNKVDRRSKDWPKGANALGRHLNVIAATLQSAGIAVARSRDGAARTTILTRSESRDASSVRAEPAGDDADDDTQPEPSHMPSRETVQKVQETGPDDNNDGCDGIFPNLEGDQPGASRESAPLRVGKKTVTTVMPSQASRKGPKPGLFEPSEGDGTCDNAASEPSRETVTPDPQDRGEVIL